jgi:hypothetical protein
MPARFDTSSFIYQKHERITILCEVEQKHKARRFLCKCDCGTVWEVALKYIKSGQIKSCGCYSEEQKKGRIVHGMNRRDIRSSEYVSWAGMFTRCYNQNDKSYKDYGARGVRVCERWFNFENFLSDMGFRPSRLHTIERQKVNGHYEPGNCVWILKSKQSLNKRNNKRYEFNGKNLLASEWSRETGINLSTLKNRLKNPTWTIQKALTSPIL